MGSVCDWLLAKHPKLIGLGIDFLPFEIINIIIERAIDFVKGSYNTCKQYELDFIPNELFDVTSGSLSTIKTEPMIITSSVSVLANSIVSNTIDDDNEDDMDDNEENEDSGRNRRNRRDLENSSMTANIGITQHEVETMNESETVAVVEEEDDEENDPKTNAKDTLISALYNSRKIYSLLVIELMKNSIMKDNMNENDKPTDLWLTSSLAILRKILRLYHTTETMLSNDNYKVILSDKQNVEKFLTEIQVEVDLNENVVVETFRSF